MLELTGRRCRAPRSWLPTAIVATLIVAGCGGSSSPLLDVRRGSATVQSATAEQADVAVGVGFFTDRRGVMATAGARLWRSVNGGSS